MRNRPLEKGILGVGAFVKKTKEQISFNMRKNVNRIFGKPDIAFIGKKIAVFCDSEFWHGYDWDHKSQEIKSRREFWIPKIERNMQRDIEVTQALEKEGWLVLRFWGKEIKANCQACADKIEKAFRER